MRFLKLFLGMSIGMACAALAQEPGDFTLSVDTRLVAVSVNIADASGRPVIKLTRDDFSIHEDGVPQEIQKFEAVETPYNILILVDCSGSTSTSQPLMGAAIDRFSAKLRPQDTISVAQFGSRTETLLNWQARSADSLRVQIKANSNICGGTDFYGALEASITRFRGISGRKGVVVLTDGVQSPFASRSMNVEGQRLQRVIDSEDDKDFQKTLKVVANSDVVFYFVAVNTDLNPDASATVSRGGLPWSSIYNPARIFDMQQARSRMQQIANATGGRITFPKKPTDVIGLYEEIVRDFGSNYGLWYSPSKPVSSDETKPRRIEVRVATPGLQVKQSRDQYTPGAR